MRFRRGTVASFTLLSVATAVPVVVLAACGSSNSDPGTMPTSTMPSTTATPTMTSTSKPDGGAPDGSTGPYANFDINHIISTGQSNSVGNGANVVMTTTQPYANLMLSSGVISAKNCDDTGGCTAYEKPTSLVPLVEGDTFFYPVETMSSSMANGITKLARGTYASTINQKDHVVMVSVHGRSGYTYWGLRKGGSNYEQQQDPAHGGLPYVLAFDDGMMEVKDAMTLAKAAGKSYVVRAVTAIHGESDNTGWAKGMPEVPLDGTDGTPNKIMTYVDALFEWQHDYETGIKAITGQTVPVPLLITQMHNWTGNDPSDTPTSKVAPWQYQAHKTSNGKVVLVTPTYMIPYAGDCLHYTSDAERWVGEYFAKAYASIVFEGKSWEPLRPKSVTVAGNVVTAKFMVPKPPLVLDTTKVSDPGNDGFEFVDAGGVAATISSVAVTAPDTVTITLATAPAAGGHLRYAFTGVPANCPGPTTGVRGNLHDSDTTPSQFGNDLANWAVTFDEPAM